MSDRDERVATYSDRVQAELARGRLRAEGIEARVASDDAGGAYPPLQRAGVHLWVGAAEAERAAEILARPVPPAEAAPGDLAEAEAAVRAEGTTRPALLGPWIDVLLLLSLGGVVGFVLSESRLLESRHNFLLYAGGAEVDENRDGRTDAWYVYRGQDLLRSRADRNFDGEPDSWDFFENGQIVRGEVDENFDGAVDGWLAYRHGSLATARFDLDHDGVADETIEYESGVPVSSRLHPKGGPVEREERYVDGALREIYAVAPDGKRTLLRRFDQLGRESNDPERPAPHEDAAAALGAR